MSPRPVVRRGYRWMQGNPATVAIVALVIGVVATVSAVGLFVRSESTRRIVTSSPCLKAPESKACAEIREKVARSEPVRNPCIAFQRVEGRRGRNCPRLYIPPRREGVVLQNPSQAGQPPEPPAGGNTGGGKGPKAETPGGTKRPPKSTEPTAKADPAPTAPDPLPVDSDPPPPAPEKGPPKDPPGLVKEVVKGIGETVKETACSLTNPLLPDC